MKRWLIMNRTLAIASATMLLTAAMIPIPASAYHSYDEKTYHGSDCKVFGSTAWTDLSFSGFGVKNLASSARNIICPITKDSEVSWDGSTNLAGLDVHVQTGSVAASYSCTAYVTTLFNATGVNSYALTSGGLKPANTFTEHTEIFGFQSVAGSDSQHDKAYLLCTLGPQVRLLGYFLFELGVTDAP